jgi:serine protease Do
MLNEDEGRSIADQDGGALPPDNSNPAYDSSAAGVNNVNNAPSQQPKAPDTDMRGKAPNPNVYYEPWQEPIYRQAPGQQPYSPGLHGGNYNTQQHPPVYPQPVKAKKTGAPWLVKAVCLVLICAVVSAGATYGVIRVTGADGKNQVILGGSNSAPAVNETSAPASAADTTAGFEASLTTTGQVMSAEDIYTMATTQVVGINSEAKTNVWGQTTSSPVSGSGFIISADGYIVTNYHVIQYAVEQGSPLTVIAYDEQSYPAKVIGYEQDNDLAVIKVDTTNLNAATFGTNKTMKVGDQVYAVGNPLGELTYTMTSGIVSALDRTIAEEDGSSINMFQIDAAVNPGNSGGPVYNDKGEVIGIVSAKYSSTGIEGLGFAIPIDDANSILTQLITSGHVTGKPSMGVTVSTVTSAAIEYYDMVEGAYVETVKPGSAADKAGLKVGDIITKMGDTDVTSVETLKAALKSYKAGDSASMAINRQGEEQTLTITLDEMGVTATASQGQPTTGDRSSS